MIGGLGLVALGVSGYFALDARSKDEEALKYCSGTECWDQRGVDLTNESRDASKLAIGAGALGGAAVLTGLLMILSGSPSGESEPVDVSARATTNGGSVWLGGAS